MKNVRGQRLNSEYQREIYDIIVNRVKDADITEMVSVLRVEVTPDLKHAKVWISVYSQNEEKRLATYRAVERAAGFIRHELSLVMRQRTVPELHFVLDGSMEYSDKINRLLNEIHKD